MNKETQKHLLLQGPQYWDEKRPVTGPIEAVATHMDPLGIRIVSTRLKQAAEQAGIQVETRLETMVPGRIDQLGPLIEASHQVWVSARFFDTCLAQEVIQIASLHGVRMIAGGYGPTSNAEFFKGATLVQGEFGPVASQLLDDLFSHQLQPVYRSISGPRWDCYNSYTLPDQSYSPHQPKLAGRQRRTQNWMMGCNSLCRYCSTARMQRGGGKDGVRYRSAENIIAEIGAMGLRPGDILMITDNNTALIPRDVLVPVLTYLKKREIFFITEASLAPLLVDHKKHGDQSLLKLMSPKDNRGGCISLAYGADDPTVARVAGSVDKEPSILLKAAPILRELGIPLNLMVIVGLDGHYFPLTFFQTAAILEEAGAPINFFFIATPYKSGEGYPKGWGDEVYENGRLLERKRSTDFNHTQVVFKPTNMTPEQLQQGYFWLYRQVYNPMRILQTCRRNLDPQIAATNPFLFGLSSGLAWGALKYATIREYSARGYVNQKMQRTLDQEYEQWKRQNT